MKNKFALIALIFILFSSFSGSILATVTNKKSSLKESVSSLNARTKSLEKQVKLLQSQIDMAHPKTAKMQKIDEYEGDNKNKYYSPVEVYAHGPAVVTSPYFGVRRAAGDEYEDESKMLTTLSKINEDLVLLQLRKKIDNCAIKNNIEIPMRPIIALSGVLEGIIDYKQEYNKKNKLDVDLYEAQLDFIGETGPWVTSAIIVTYDKDKPNDDTRASNSKLRIARGFVTVGQLKKSPLYLTIGQIYAPFGRYSSNMATDPSTKLLGRFKDRMVILGYSKDSFNVQLYNFSGETKGVNNGSANSFLGHTGFHMGNNYKIEKFKIDIEGSIIGNIAETDGMQKIFKNNESIHSRVWGIDGRAKVGYDPFAISAEYVGAARRFDSRDLMFNNAGAKPQALNVEGSIGFEIFDKPNNFSIGYGQTWQALALGLPKNTFFAEYDLAYFKCTLFAIEYRHDINYGWNDTATNVTSIYGKHKNTVTAKVYVYF